MVQAVLTLQEPTSLMRNVLTMLDMHAMNRKTSLINLTVIVFSLKRIAVRRWKSRFGFTETEPSLSEIRIFCTRFAACKIVLKRQLATTFVNLSGRMLEATVIAE